MSPVTGPVMVSAEPLRQIPCILVSFNAPSITVALARATHICTWSLASDG
jgi:hypothetical protein